MTEVSNQATFLDRNTICFERRFAADSERVWSAITVESELNQWFMETQLQLEVGGTFSFKHGWDGWIGDLSPDQAIQFNSKEDAFTRFEIKPDAQETHFRLIDKLPKDFVIQPGDRQDDPTKDADLEQMRRVEYNQPGGPGTHWTGVVAGWHCFVDSLESYLAGEEPEDTYNRKCLLYDPLLIEHYAKVQK
ncbi:SRPBCC domain-containing protein [Chloroflexi bacterium TSY]|nr:SRPBCC domain-containing protein [Chloroflexi bacterium TSY]